VLSLLVSPTQWYDSIMASSLAALQPRRTYRMLRLGHEDEAVLVLCDSRQGRRE
jgi:hypothetical protein